MAARKASSDVTSTPSVRPNFGAVRLDDERPRRQREPQRVARGVKHRPDVGPRRDLDALRGRTPAGARRERAGEHQHVRPRQQRDQLRPQRVPRRVLDRLRLLEQFGGRPAGCVDRRDGHARLRFDRDEIVRDTNRVEVLADECARVAADKPGRQHRLAQRVGDAGGVNRLAGGRLANIARTVDGVDRDPIERHRTLDGRGGAEAENHGGKLE